MKLLKRIFFDTEDNKIGHYSVYMKSNGNIYITYFIEERYAAFQEFTSNGYEIQKEGSFDFKMYNKTTYDYLKEAKC